MTLIPPGSTIGIIGGGQLGRMLSIAAAQLGYRSHIYSPDASGPAADVAARWVQGRYDDERALTTFAGRIHVATYEFENVDPAPLAAVAARVPLFPPLDALRIAQDRIAEKMFAARHGARTAQWCGVASRADLDAALAEIGCPAILKTTRFGYDGKGQARIDSVDQASEAWDAIAGGPAILERFVAFSHEFSILVAHGQDGSSLCWDAPQNIHKHGILATSIVPADAAIHAQIEEARAVAVRIADALNYVGVLALEFFVGADGPVFNEMAPRVHNSGHWTIEGAETSQFENHIRAICGLPLGQTSLTGRGATMENLIGDDAERWPELLADPALHVHLYGKGRGRPGRKMGHVTRVIRA